MLMSGPPKSVPFNYASVQRDDKNRFSVYDNCQLNPNTLALDPLANELNPQPITDIAAVPMEYEQITWIDDEQQFFLENFGGYQFGSLTPTNNGLCILRVHLKR